MRLQSVCSDQRGDQARDQQREKHCGRHGQAELLEILAGEPTHEADRQKHSDDRRRRCDHRESDLVGGIERRLITGLAHAHMPDDVLDFDNRIVNQHARHQRQRQQTDRVEGEVLPVHEGERRNRRQRDRERRDRRGPPVAEENEHYKYREERTFDHGGQRRLVGLASVLHSGEHSLDRNVGRFDQDARDLRLHTIERSHIRGATRLEDTKRRRCATVESRYRALLPHRITYLGDVGQSHVGAVEQADLRGTQCQRRIGRSEHSNRLLASAHLCSPAGRVDIQLPQLLIHLGGRQAESLHA